MRREVATLCLAAFATALPAISHAPPQPIVALAPVEVVLDGRNELVGVVVDADGTAYVSDRGSGHVYRLAPDGTLTLAASNLDRPAGLAIDLEGRLLVAEERANRILRLEPGGAVTTLGSGIRTPRWIAVAPSGAVYVSAHRLVDPDGQDREEGREIVLVQPGVGLSVVAGGIRRLESLVLQEDALMAATMGLESGPEDVGALLRFPLLDNDALGPAQLWLGTGLIRPVGLADDVLGAVYVSSHLITDIPELARRAVGKLHPDRRLSGFAENLENPQDIALGPDGSLYVADGRSGRLLRFRAPAAPALEPVPPFATAPTVQLHGTAVPNARLDVVTDQAEILATTTADTSGNFAVSTPLRQNILNELFALATPHGGEGLTGAPAMVTVVHDDQAPAVTLQEPPAGAFLRRVVAARARATDAGTGASSLAIAFAGQVAGSATNPHPAQHLTTTVSIDTTAHQDGTHTVSASAEDAAGNRGFTSWTVIVDNTPPDTEITSGGEATAGGAVTFAFTAADNLTPVASLVFSWRIDGDAWSPFVAETTATVDVGPGPHVFEVRARDLAGNKDPTPATRPFTVGAGLQVTIVEPADGATVAEGSVLVRGTIVAGGQEVAVTVNGVPTALRGDAFAAMVRTEPGALLVSAHAATAAGAAAEHSVGVTVVASTTPLSDLRVSPASGVAPLGAAFSLAGVGGGVVELDADGDGLADFTGPALDGHVHTFTSPGVYVATATVTDDQGARSVWHAVVDVLDRAAADAFFRTRWTVFRDRLSSADIEGALAGVVGGRREKYRGPLQVLAPDLAAIAGGFSDMTVLSFGEHVVEGVVTRVRDGIAHLHFVYFMRDDDGIWKIVEM